MREASAEPTNAGTDSCFRLLTRGVSVAIGRAEGGLQNLTPVRRRSDKRSDSGQNRKGVSRTQFNMCPGYVKCCAGESR